MPADSRGTDPRQLPGPMEFQRLAKKKHDIAIIRENVEKTGGLAVISYLPHHPRDTENLCKEGKASKRASIP